MENMKTMTVQMPEGTYQRMKEYLKRHQVKQKDFLTRLLEGGAGKRRSFYGRGRQWIEQRSCFFRRIRV
jgi:hypothetical protein